MEITVMNLTRTYSKSAIFLLITATMLNLTACQTLPDYEMKRLRVDAGYTAIATEWDVQLMINNKGGDKGLGPDNNGFPHAPIPILFTATIPNSNLNGCPSESRNGLTLVMGQRIEYYKHGGKFL